MSCRSSIPPKKPSLRGPCRIRRARRRTAPLLRAVPKPGVTIIRHASSATAPKFAKRPAGSGWSFIVHRTDRTAAELLPQAARPARHWPRHHRHRTPPHAAPCGATRMIGLPLAFAQPLVLIGLVTSAGIVAAVAAGAAAPAPHQLSADTHPVRHCAEGRNARPARRGG